MNKKLLTGLLILAFPVLVNAQKGNQKNLKYELTGEIVDADNDRPLEYATVAVLNPADSSMIAGGITDAKGRFFLKSRQGKVLVNVQFISYEQSFPGR